MSHVVTLTDESIIEMCKFVHSIFIYTRMSICI